ncbi:MAG TPA: M56 family metallopeptidase, partial [Planctomycetaceae bacterium]|nr:M56 family metallopeptidase [Planctomycetaceae bacterium]
MNPPERSSEQPAVRIWPRILVGFMLVASALGFGRLLVGLAMLVLLVRRSRRLDDERLTRIVRELRQRLGLRRRVSLRDSDSMSTAATFSWPATILLPAEWRDWDDATLQAVLAHVLAHIKRRDFSRWMLAQCSLVMHYYHPLVHYLASRFRLQQELAADVLASEIIGDRDLYRNLLGQLALAQPKRSFPRMATAFLPREATILRRIEMLAQPRTIFFLPSVRQAIALAVVALAAFGVVGLRGTSERTLAQSTTTSASTKQTGESEEKVGKTKIPWESLFDGVWDVKTAIWRGSPRWKPTADVDRFSIVFSNGKYYLLKTRGETKDTSIVEEGTVAIGRCEGPIARLSFVRAGSTRRIAVWGLAITNEQMDLMLRQHVPYDTYGTFTIVKRKADDPSVQDLIKKVQTEHHTEPPSSQDVFELLIRDTKPMPQGQMAVASQETPSPSLYVRCAKCHSSDWKSRRLSFSYVPLDAAFVATFRAAKLMERPVGRALVHRFKIDPLGGQTSSVLHDSRQLTLASLVWKSSSEQPFGVPDPSLLIAYLKTPYSKEKTQETFRPILGEMETREVGQHQYWR